MSVAGVGGDFGIPMSVINFMSRRNLREGILFGTSESHSSDRVWGLESSKKLYRLDANVSNNHKWSSIFLIEELGCACQDFI